MISGGHDTGFNKLKTINRRMFIFSAAKAVIFFWYCWKIIFSTNK